MTSVNVTTNKNTITVQEGDATTVTVATQGPQGASIAGPAGADGGSNIVLDSTPQLGGDLDANGNDIDMGTNVITDARVGEWLATKTKVDGIENAATADQTGAEIKTAYEAESDTNAFTDALKTKLEGIEASATGDQTNAEIRTAVEAASDSNVFTDADHTKLNGIESSATADQTGAEIKTAYEAESDTNAFTDAEKTKLSGIATSANNYVHPNHSGEVTSSADGATVIASNIVDEDNLKISNSPSNGTFLQYKDGTDELTWATPTDTNTTYTAGTGLNLSGTEFSVTSLALTTVQEAANETAMLALTTQEGDVVVRTDENKSYVKNAGTAGTMADFTLLRTPTDAVLSVNGNTGAITAAQIASAVEAASDSNTFTDADHTKLNGIETSATADQTGAEIKTAYEAESDTNAYTDAEKTKLAGIEASATADQTDAEIRAAVEAATDSNVFTDADHTKLNAIEANATADQTGAEIKTAYEAEADTNAFTDTLKTKLDGIATGAEVNVQSDWNSSSGDSQILNKPTIPTNTDTTYSISCVDGDNTDEEKIRLTAGGDGSGTDDVVLEAGTGLSIARSGDKITFTNTVTDTNTQLTTEEVQDIIGAMVAGNTETNISVTYDDTNGKLDFVSTDTNTTYSVVTSSADGLAPQLPGSHGGKFLKADGTWEVPPDTNTQVNIDDTPVNGVTDEAISSNWAYDHNAATGNSAHVPAAGSSGQFLKHDGTWGTPPDTTYSVQDGQLSQNNFTDADHTKLDGIETSADVTDATNVDAAGAVMNSDLDGKGELLVGDGSGDPTALAVGTNNYVLTADSGEATGVKWAAAATGTPEGTAILSTGESGGTKFLREDGDGTCSWQTVSGGGGGTPGGANTQVQYNSSGSFAGSSNLTFDGTNLAVGGTVTATSTALATGGVRKIFTSASSPQASDGAVGDIWLKF